MKNSKILFWKGIKINKKKTNIKIKDKLKRKNKCLRKLKNKANMKIMDGI